MPADAPDVLLLPLTDRGGSFLSCSCPCVAAAAAEAVAAPRLDRVAVAVVAAPTPLDLASDFGFVAFLAGGAGVGRVVAPFILSRTREARPTVAARAADFEGEIVVRTELGLRGEAGREMWGRWGERMGECGKVRELEDLGERIVDGLVGWRVVAAVLVRFLGLERGSVWEGSGAFSLSVCDWDGERASLLGG